MLPSSRHAFLKLSKMTSPQKTVPICSIRLYVFVASVEMCGEFLNFTLDSFTDELDALAANGSWDQYYALIRHHGPELGYKM